MKKALGTLDFKVNFRHDNQIQEYPLPIEIRHLNLKLAMTGLTSEKLKIEPGQYLVSSKLPAGQELFGQIEIKANEQSTAILKLEEIAESPHETEALHHFLIADRQKVLSAFERFSGTDDFEPPLSIDHTEPIAQLRVFSGNLLSGNAKQINPDALSVKSIRGLREFRFFGSSALQIVQLIQKDTPPMNMVLPTIGENGCQVFVTTLVDGKYTLDTHLDNSIADMLLRYSQKGFHQQTELLCKKIDAGKLLFGKFSNPLAAAVGAYSLLRFGELEMLNDWTENLRNWFTWLPDGSAIRGEHLARMGKHEKAIVAFLEIAERGLPIFSDGLAFATDRLSTYVELGERFANDENLQKIKKLLLKLQKFTSYTDFREPFTTFTGTNVNEPSDEHPAKMPKNKKSIDLGNLNL